MGKLYLYCLFGDQTNRVTDYKLPLLAGNTGRGLFLMGATPPRIEGNRIGYV
jgi:hypothetical protein